MASKINSSNPNFYELFEKLLARRATRVEDATKVSADIIEKVRKSGDEALIKLTKELDGLDLTSTGLIIESDEIDEAINRITTDQYDALKFDCGSKEGFVQANIHFAKKQNIIS